jgi:hypothetical protein
MKGMTLDTLKGAALIATFIGVLITFAMWVSMEGLTPEQIELLKAKLDAMALPVAEPPHKKKWAQ